MAAFKQTALAVVSGLTLLAGPALAQSVGGTAVGTSVNAPGVSSQSAVASVPSTGGFAADDADTFGVPNLVSANWLSAVTTGAVTNKKSGAQSVSDVSTVSVLNGVIQADVVTAIASSSLGQFTASSDGGGSGFTNLTVNGVAYTTDVAPNTRVDLPGVGYVVLNEQTSSGDGVTSSGITVTMIRVVLTDALTGLQTGEIVVGSASSSVTR